MSAAVDVGQPDDRVARPDDLLDRGRRILRGSREAVNDVGRVAGDEQLGLGGAERADDAAAGGAVGGLVGAGDGSGARVRNELAGGGLFIDRSRVGDVRGRRGDGRVMRRRGVVGADGVVGLVGAEPPLAEVSMGAPMAPASEVLAAPATPGLTAATTANKLEQRTASSARTRKETTSFVGLRG